MQQQQDTKVEKTNEELQKEEKEKFEELMQKQEQQRKAFAAKKKAMQDKYRDPKEMQNFVANKISTMKQSIEKLLKVKPNKQDLLQINQIYQELDDYYINTSYAMNPYDKKQYKEQIENVLINIRVYKRKLKPRKKFRFKSQFKQKIKAKQQERQRMAQLKTTKNESQQKETQEVENKNLKFIQGLEGLENVNKVLKPKVDFQDVFKLEKLKNCKVELQGNLQTAYLLDLENCKISFGGVKTSVYITNCNNSEVSIMAQQIRIHRSTKTHFRTFCSGDTIIEDSTRLKFSNYNYKYEGIENDIKEIGFDKKQNNWRNVKDFKWLKQEHSPNFELCDDQ